MMPLGRKPKFSVAVPVSILHARINNTPHTPYFCCIVFDSIGIFFASKTSTKRVLVHFVILQETLTFQLARALFSI